MEVTITVEETARARDALEDAEACLSGVSSALQRMAAADDDMALAVLADAVDEQVGRFSMVQEWLESLADDGRH